jgi:deazaflavin-dependent oxidoreductase (nitroreductase family)
VVPPDAAGAQFCFLTTTGRRTGRPHTIEIWFVWHDERAWLLTEPDGRADWVANLRVAPEVQLRIATTTYAARAIARDALPPDAPVRARLAEKYQASYGATPLLPWATRALAVSISLDAVVEQ